MLFGVKANVGSNPTVTAKWQGPCFLYKQREVGVLFCPEIRHAVRVIGQNAVTQR
jgi:hypothetical protein